MKPIRLVAPFFTLPAENHHHQELADFDWIDAIRMLSHSAELACGVPVEVITDASEPMPLRCIKFQTHHRRLMLWQLEACVRYLQSDYFDRDTVMLDCDQLVYQDLSKFFAANVDLGLLVRPTLKHKDTWKKVLNGVQFWNLRAKKRLAQFYREALARAEQLRPELLIWGADTAALVEMIEPVTVGLAMRHGVRVEMIDYQRVLEALSEDQIAGMRKGIAPRPIRAVMDFRYSRKLNMRQAYEMTIGKAVAA